MPGGLGQKVKELAERAKLALTGGERTELAEIVGNLPPGCEVASIERKGVGPWRRMEVTLSCKDVDDIAIDAATLEMFLRNVPNPILLTVRTEDCEPCDDLEEAIDSLVLPNDIAKASVTLKEDSDVGIADLLGLEGVPTVIALRQGQEVGRANTPEELAALLTSLEHGDRLITETTEEV